MRRQLKILITSVILVILIQLLTFNDASISVHGWNIDYDSPEKYLQPGEQSLVTDEETIKDLKSTFRNCRGLEGLRDIYMWMNREFTWYKGGGKLIGKTTIDQLLNRKELSGCSDCSLVYSAVARYLGYPTIMVDTAGIEWAEKFQAGYITSYSGHVFVEVYNHPNWILIDPSTGEFIREYDYLNPVIPITKENEKLGYYSLLKGKDMWDYGVTDPESLHMQLRAFAQRVDIKTIEMPNYKIESLNAIVTEKTTSQTITTIMNTKTTHTLQLPVTSTTTVTSPVIQTEMEKETISLKHQRSNLIIFGAIIVISLISTGTLLLKKRK